MKFLRDFLKSLFVMLAGIAVALGIPAALAVTGKNLAGGIGLIAGAGLGIVVLFALLDAVLEADKCKS